MGVLQAKLTGYKDYEDKEITMEYPRSKGGRIGLNRPMLIEVSRGCIDEREREWVQDLYYVLGVGGELEYCNE